MFEEAGELCQDISVLRRLSFATNYLNKETPNYWDFVKAFVFMSLEEKPDSKQVKICKTFNTWTAMLWKWISLYFSRCTSLKDFKVIHLELFCYLLTIHADCVEEVCLC